MTTDLLVTKNALAGKLLESGFEYLSFENVVLPAASARGIEAGHRELALVVLGGRCSVSSTRGEWPDIGGRANVFAGKPYTLYLPPDTRFVVVGGAVHAHFGDYGSQRGDGAPTIGAAEAQRQIDRRPWPCSSG